MKLRNKKTGEIIEAVIVDHGAEWGMRNMYTNEEAQIYDSLAELCEDWEDASEEPKEYWVVDYIECGVDKLKYCPEDHAQDDFNKQIGNYFETRKEAEKAVEKLKAWKRLKDKGFKFEGWDNTDRSTIHNFSLFVSIEDLNSINKDLDLLFGGEE